MSGFVETLLAKLDEEINATAHAALAKPQQRDDFEYGRVSGLYGGLHRARDILKGMISEADDKDGQL